MTKEQFEKAKKLDAEIKKYSELIGRIRAEASYKKKLDEESRERIRKYKGIERKDGWNLLRFFKLVFKERKVIAVPHYEFARGIEMDADAELIGVVLDYLEEKKKECETEFEQIGGSGE